MSDIVASGLFGLLVFVSLAVLAPPPASRDGDYKMYGAVFAAIIGAAFCYLLLRR